MFVEYRLAWLAAGTTANNMNREPAYRHAVFNEVKRVNQWKRVNTQEKLRAFKIKKTTLVSHAASDTASAGWEGTAQESGKAVVHLLAHGCGRGASVNDVTQGSIEDLSDIETHVQNGNPGAREWLLYL